VSDRSAPKRRAEADNLVATFKPQLNGKKGPVSFSSQSVESMVELRNDYTEALGLEAIRLAKIDRADSVSAAHVNEADRIIRGGKDRADWLKWLAALALGVGIPLFVQYFTTKNPPKSLGAWLAISLVVGSLALGAALMVEIRERRKFR
jgi:hypothetical protein